MSTVLLADVKMHLNIAGNGQDVELQGFIDAAERAIENRVGPLSPQLVTEVVSGGGMLVLNTLPVLSLTSVSGVAVLPLDGLTLNEGAGYVSRAGTFAETSYTVVYQAGHSPTPADLILAVKELVRHLWASQRGSGQRPGSPAPAEIANTLPGSAYTFPIRVEQLLLPYQMPGFA